MGKPRSKLVNYKNRVFRTVGGYTTEIHFGKQSKHMIGRPEYVEGKSIITVSVPRLQDLVNRKAGTGDRQSRTKERIDFGEIIGIYVSEDGSKKIPTTKGVIHYSKSGTHVVPANP